MLHVGKKRVQLVRTQALGQRSPQAGKMAGFDRIAEDLARFEAIVKEMLDRMEAPLNRGGG